MPQRTPSINKNTVYHTIKSIFSIIFPLITFPYISRVLLTENVGKVNFGSSIVSYFSLIASLGITTYAIRECSKVKERREEFELIASEIFSINILSTIVSYIALGITLIVAKPLKNYRVLICIQSSIILFTTLGADWINTAMEDFRYIAIRTVVTQILSIALMIIFVHRPADYLKYAVISLVSSGGSSFLNIFYRRRYCRTRFLFKMNLKKHLPPILLLFSLMLSQIIYTNSDMTILGLVKGDYEVGLYSTSVKIYSLVNTTIASIFWVVMPQLSTGFANNDYVSVNKLLRYALNFIVFLGIPCFCGIEIIADQLIGLIAGEAFLGASTSLRILGIALMFSFWGGWIGNIIMIPSGHEKICLYSSIVSASLNIGLNILLIPKWGLNAAAFTTALSEFVGILCKKPFIDKRIKILGLWKMLQGPIIGGLGIITLGLIIRHLFNSYWLVSIVTIFTSVLWYAMILYIMKDDFYRSYALPYITKLKKGVKK